MQNTPDPNTVLSAPPNKALFRTVMLAGSVFFIPVLIGTLVVLAGQRLLPSSKSGTAADAAAALTARLHDGSAVSVAQLTALRRDLRGAGLPTDEADLRLWAARATEPERLFRVPPPDAGKRWNWHLANDGFYALAVAAAPDAAGRRAVGLYDLASETWAWNSVLPWPETHEAPYVFDRRTIVRYAKNDTRFALEVDRDGKIISIDKLGAGAFAMPPPARPDPRFPGLTAVAARHNVFFASDPQDGSLHGYAGSSLPGLRHAGPCDATTAFSGNGLMKFSVVTGIVTVADSLTQTTLQTYRAWRADSDTVVNGTAASLDGSNLVVSLTSTFAGPPPVKRDWSMSIDLYSGKGKTNTGDQQPPVPERAASLTAVAARHNVFFASDPQDGSLHGYASSPLPGLRHAGPCDATTAFSGNGFMKFSVVTGIVTVADSLTLTTLQTYKAWPAESDTTVRGMAAALDGSNLVVSLTSMFAGTPPVKRDWSMSIDLYSGKGKTNTGDQQPPVPEHAASLTTLSPDGKWRLTVDADNALTVTAENTKTPATTPAARVALAPLGLRAPIQSIAFLEGGRHLLIRQRAEAWLLDFTVARSYGGLMARAATCSKTISMDSYRVRRETNGTEKAGAKLATSAEGYGISEDYDADELASDSFADATAPSYLLLRTELLVANQAWGYAAATLEEIARLQASDLRAPQINPLLFARCQILAGQDKKARTICRDALRKLLQRPVVYDSATGTTRSPPNLEETDNRMIRYHLQSILFAK